MGAPSTIAHAGAHAETLDALLVQWQRAPTILVAGAIASIWFVALVRSRELSRRARAGRYAAWAGAWVALLLAVGSPIDAAGGVLVSAHMLQHMLLGDLAPALLAWALIGLASTGSSPLLATACRLVEQVPLVVVVVAWAAAWGIWHVPSAYQLALDVPAVHAVEHASMLLVGVLLWLSVIRPRAAGSASEPARIAAIVVVMFFGTALANTLSVTGEPLYPAMIGESEQLLGWSTRFDQQVAGVLMLVMQALTVTAALWHLVRRHLATGRSALVPAPRPADAGADHPLAW